MREPLSRMFIESFVETCMDMGLSKEATAELLQRRSAIHAAEQSPAFADGYLSALDQTPASDRVRVRPGYVEKRAAGSGKLIGQGLSSIARGIGGGLMGLGRGVVNTAVANPRTAKAIGGAAVAGSAGYGLSNYLENRHRAPGVPYLAPGGYNPKEEKQDYENELDRYSRGIANTNKTIDGAGNRRRVLQQAVDSNSPNSAQALAELRQLDSEVGRAKGVRQNHLEQLNSQGSVTASRLAAVQERQQTLQARQKSPFWRGLHRLTFRNPDKSYAEAINALQPNAAALSHQNQLITDQRRRLQQNYLGARSTPVAPAQMQREFFPTQ